MTPFMFTALVEAAVLFGVFVYLHRSREEDYLRWWAMAWLASVLRHGSTLVGALAGIEELRIVEQLAALAMAAFVLRGTLALEGRRMARGFLVLLAACALWVVVAHARRMPFLAVTVPTFTLLGTTTIAAGVVVWRTRSSGVGRWVAAGALVLWGIHQLDYPLLRPIVPAAKWGYAIASILEAATAIGFLVLANERALLHERDAATRHRELLESLGLGAFRTTFDGRFLSANQALVEMLGYASYESLAEVDIGRDLYADPEQRDALMAAHQGDVLPTSEVRWRRADGSTIDVLIQGTRVRDDDGEPDHFEGIAQDVTERRRMQRILEQSSRMQALGRLAGGVAHDFNNLLTVIRGGTSVLLSEEGRAPDDLELLREIDTASERASVLTTQLLSMARGRRKAVVVQDVAEVMEQATPVLRRILGDDAELTIEIEPGISPVKLEEGAVDQMMLNLVANAADAESSRVTIEAEGVELGEREAATLALHPGPYVRLRLHDDGKGMDAETQARVFEPLFTTRAGGTGLGLATVFASVERARGRIEVKSAPGEGATFTIFLPRSTADSSTPPPSSSKLGGGRTILVVDDEAAVRRAVVRMLEGLDFDVLAAAGPDEAQALVDGDAAIDVVLCDVMLDGSSGVDLVRALRPRLPRATVLFMSGYPSTELDDVDDVRLLAKPFTMQELAKSLEEAGARPSAD